MSECKTISCPTCSFQVAENFVEQRCPRCQAIIESKFICGSCHSCAKTMLPEKEQKENPLKKLLSLFNK